MNAFGSSSTGAIRRHSGELSPDTSISLIGANPGVSDSDVAIEDTQSLNASIALTSTTAQRYVHATTIGAMAASRSSVRDGSRNITGNVNPTALQPGVNHGRDCDSVLGQYVPNSGDGDAGSRCRC